MKRWLRMRFSLFWYTWFEPYPKFEGIDYRVMKWIVAAPRELRAVPAGKMWPCWFLYLLFFASYTFTGNEVFIGLALLVCLQIIVDVVLSAYTSRRALQFLRFTMQPDMQLMHHRLHKKMKDGEDLSGLETDFLAAYWLGLDELSRTFKVSQRLYDAPDQTRHTRARTVRDALFRRHKSR